MGCERKNRRDASAAATRARIIRRARAVFGAKGFDAASLAEIVATAEVTTGAIYHHFGDKKGLFLAVAESVEEEIMAGTGEAAAAQTEPWDKLAAGVDAMLEICAAPDVLRIVFIDAATVIGPAAWREIELKYAFGTMHRALDRLMALGIVRAGSSDLLASILLGALVEAARGIARAQDKDAAIREARATVSQLLLSLRVT
jgi:AcrR family transcriptional regulator